MDLDLSCVESFVVLAYERHFGRAAACLNLSSSALSKRLARLERQVGVRLIDRDPGGYVELTPAGDRFISHARELLRNAREARRHALQGEGSPIVHLGIPGSPSDHIPVPTWKTMVTAIAQTLPTCRLQACSVPYGRVEESVLTGRVDVLLSTGEFDHSGLSTTVLMRVGRVLLVPVHHELAGERRIRAMDMADLPLIREPTATTRWMKPWLLGDLRDPADTPTVDVSARTLADVQKAVLDGRAATVASATLVPMVRPGLTALPLRDVPSIPLFAVRRRHDERDEVLTVIEALRVLTAAFVTTHSQEVPDGSQAVAAPANS